MYLLEIALIFFLLGAVVGILMLFARRRDEVIPTVLPIVHGVFVVPGFASLCAGIAFEEVRSTWLIASLVLFVLAVLGGLTLMLGFHVRGKPVPVAIILGHGSVAGIAFALLIIDRALVWT